MMQLFGNLQEFYNGIDPDESGGTEDERDRSD